MVTIDPSFVSIENTTDKEVIGVAYRWRRIEAIYSAIDSLPKGVQPFVNQHRNFMSSGEPINSTLTRIVMNLGQALISALPNWADETDPLPALEHLLGIEPPAGVKLPPPNEIEEDEPAVSVRSAHEYRLAKIRGAAGRKFSASIQTAYGNRCAFCGAQYGGITSVRSGLDAAHILAWSKYDLDVVPNGLSLCKLHHWAFDAALLMPVYERTAVCLKFTELATENFTTETLAKLGEHGFVVPERWLPRERALWPSERYLELLYADLAIEFAA
ncbi:HNH endonuclease [Brevibacterium casei]